MTTFPPKSPCPTCGSDLAIPAAPPVQMEAVALGEFDHHPDPAVDFCIEVEEIVAQHWNLTHGLHAPTAWQLGNRVRRAMDFRVGGDPSAVAAKDQLREIEKALASPVPSSERDDIIEMCAKVAEADTSFMMLQDFGLQQTCTQIRENIAYSIRSLKSQTAQSGEATP
jgi:hypothetical protein